MKFEKSNYRRKISNLIIYLYNTESISGVPSCQRTVAFEKACVLFNMGAIYTQIGAKQDRSTTKGLDAAVDSFLRAAGTFRYIHENFTNAPSMDLGPEMLEMFVQLMLVSIHFYTHLYINLKYSFSPEHLRSIYYKQLNK